jgi:protein O-mannosyl-transferase
MGRKSKIKSRNLQYAGDPKSEVAVGRDFSPQRFVHILIIVITGLLVYSNTFHGPFQWDEMKFIAGNPVVKDLSFFAHPEKAAGLQFYSGLKSRYVGYLTFALNYKFGGLAVAGYHIVNLAIHVMNSLLVYSFVLLTFRTPFLKASGLKKHAASISLFSALLFVSHPLQTEAVTYVFQRLASLVVLFYLLSIVMYIKGRLVAEEARGKEKGLPIAHRPSPIAFYSFSLLFAVLAMKTKENAFTLPLVLLLYEFLFFTGPGKKRILRLIPFLSTMMIIPLTLSGTDNPLEVVMRAPASHGYKGIARADYMLTQFRVIVTYLRLLFWPANQNFDYDYPLYHKFFSPEVTASFLFLLVIFGFGVYLVFRSRAARFSARGILSGESSRLIGFGILWFFITLSVESSIIPIPMIICEYRVYLPSVGAFAALSTALFAVIEKLREKFVWADKAGVSAVVIIVLALSTTAYARNQVWASRISLWEDVVAKSPNKATARNLLGVFYAEGGRAGDAIREFQTAVNLDPGFAEAYKNLGRAFYSQQRFDEALDKYSAAVRIKPDYAEVHNDIGSIYFIKGYTGNAISEFHTAIKFRPDFFMAYYNLGTVYYRQGDIEDAEKQFQAAINRKPDYVQAHNSLGVVYLKQGRVDDALHEFRTAVSLAPGNKQALNNLDLLYREMAEKQRQK